MSVEDHTVSFSLELNLSPQARSQIREAQTILYRTANVVRSLSGSPALNNYMMVAQRAIMISNQLRLAINAAKLAMLGAGPVGWFMFGLSVAETAISIAGSLPEDSLDMELDAT